MKLFSSQHTRFTYRSSAEDASLQTKIALWARSIPDHVLIITAIILIPFLFILLVIAGVEILPMTGYNIAVRAEAYEVTPTPFKPMWVTPTPFQPLSHATQIVTTHPPELQATPTPAVPITQFHGLNFAPGQSRITINITPPTEDVNLGRTIQMSFLPGDTCIFSDGFGCINIYQNDAGGRIIFITLHSGLGGEAQTLRHAIEGTSMGLAGFSLAKTQSNLTSLINAQVSIFQSGIEDHALSLLWLTRVPAVEVQAYFDRAIPDAVAYTAELDPGMAFVTTTTDTLIIFETCGWRIMEEEWPAGQPETSGAVYLGVIGIGDSGP